MRTSRGRWRMKKAYTLQHFAQAAVLFTLGLPGSSAFQPLPVLTPRPISGGTRSPKSAYLWRHVRPHRLVESPLFQHNSDIRSGNPISPPFFAGVAETTRGDSATEHKSEHEDHDSDELRKQAETLKAQAEKARLEADKMDAMLTLDKIRSLEKKLGEKSTLEKHPEMEEELRSQLDALKKKLKGEPPEPKASKNVLPKPVVEQDSKLAAAAAAELGDLFNQTALSTDVYDDIPPMPKEQLQADVDAFLQTPKFLREITATAAGFPDDSNATAVVEKMYIDEQTALRRLQLYKEGKVPPVAEEDMEKAREGYDKLPEPIQDILAKTVGLEDGRDSEAVLSKLAEEGRIMSQDGTDGFEVEISPFMDLFDPDFIDRANFVTSLLPSETRKDGHTPSEEDVDTFFAKVLGKDSFNPRSKPERIPGGVIIRGENCVPGDSADALVEVLDRKFEESSVKDKLRFYFINDVTPLLTEEEAELDETVEPVILVTGPDLTPQTQAFVKPVVTFMSLASVGAFAFGALSLNEGVVDRVLASTDAGNTDLSWLTDLAAPLFGAILATQLAHEASHQLVALKEKFKVGPPTLLPSLQLGLMGAITPIKTPPKNTKALFDFAIAGPVVGFMTSLILLYAGIEKTAFMDSAAHAQLPGLPVQLVRSSSLVGGMLEWLLGDGILVSADPATSLVALHPFAIAGFVGLMVNALSLLPIGNTDGGRISQVLFGRNMQRVLQGLTLFTMVLSGFFGLDESNLLLSYALFATFFQRQTEIPCRNEVDQIGFARGLLAAVMAVLVALTLVPLPQ